MRTAMGFFAILLSTTGCNALDDLARFGRPLDDTAVQTDEPFSLIANVGDRDYAEVWLQYDLEFEEEMYEIVGNTIVHGTPCQLEFTQEGRPFQCDGTPSDGVRKTVLASQADTDGHGEAKGFIHLMTVTDLEETLEITGTWSVTPGTEARALHLIVTA